MPKIPRDVLRNVGQLSGGPSFELNNGQSGTVLEWRPRPEFRVHFPADFQLRMNSVSSGGLQVLAPCDGGFPLQPFRGGIGILKSCDALPPFADFNQDARFAFFQKAMHAREYSGRDFVNASDLRERGILSASRPHGILPDDIGLNGNQEGETWTISRLMQEGREAATDCGISNPPEAQIIRLGFLSAARRNPLTLRPSETESLVRNAFFALPPASGRLSHKVRTIVSDQLAGAIQDRLGSIEQFNSILVDEKADILRRIAKHKSVRDNAISREQVRHVIIELGWQSFLFCGECVEAQMRAFEASMPQPLVGDARRIFELFYYRQPMLGKLPFAMLTDRRSFVQEAMLEVVKAKGNRESFAVLHRMLNYYSQLIGRRRDADVEYQRMRHGNVLGVEALHENSGLSASPPSSDEFRQIVQEQLIQLGIAKDDDFQGEWTAYLAEDQPPGEVHVQIKDLRTCERLNRVHEFNKDQFEEVARALRGISPPPRTDDQRWAD